MIKAVIFDCFGVLTGDKWKEFVATLPEAQREPARELNRALDRGQLNLREFSDEMHGLTGSEPERVEDVINAEMHKNTDLLSYIKELKQDYKIGLISNVSSNWIRESFLSKSELSLFDDVLLSYEVGITKPDSRIYLMAAERLGVQANECLLIDDGVGNCEGANAVGMQAILYSDFVSMKQQLEKLLANSNN